MCWTPSRAAGSRGSILWPRVLQVQLTAVQQRTPRLLPVMASLARSKPSSIRQHMPATLGIIFSEVPTRGTQATQEAFSFGSSTPLGLRLTGEPKLAGEPKARGSTAAPLRPIVNCSAFRSAPRSPAVNLLRLLAQKAECSPRTYRREAYNRLLIGRLFCKLGFSAEYDRMDARIQSVIHTGRMAV